MVARKQLLSIQSLTRTEAGDGTTSDKWLTTDREWASISPLRGRERIEAKKVQSKVTHRIVMRYVGGLTTENRLSWNSRVFNIEAVLNKGERNVELEIEAVELV